MTSRNIRARRMLSDLFAEGVEIRFGRDEEGNSWGKIGPFLDSRGDRAALPDDQVAMYIRPADPLQRDMSMREANARRARALVRAKRDKDSEEHLTIVAFLTDMSDETLIDYILMGDTQYRQAEAEREILAMDEWKEMDAYQDAMRQFDNVPVEDLADNEEWEALLELDRKYGKQLTDREKELRDAQREVLRMQTNAGQRQELENKALERRAELVGTQAFMDEYELCMQFYSVRDVDDNSKTFFDKPEELAQQPQVVRDTINEALLPFITDVESAKNSRRAVSGSEPSEPPSKPETSEPSTPEAQTA